MNRKSLTVAAKYSIAELRSRNLTVVLSHGMGVETAAIWKLWVERPETRPFDSWSQVIVVTSQVGEEVDQTIKLMETHQLPEMERLGVRFVELARRGHLEADGIVIMQDTRAPVTMHPKGWYRLSDELLMAGTVPQFSGEHRCALKFKAFVIERWMAYELRGETAGTVIHVFGYNANEPGRVSTSEFHIDRHNHDREIAAGDSKAPIVVFGFNADELGRIQRSAEYDGPHRIGHYPLLELQWGRDECKAWLKEQYGVEWIKSACNFCPFNEEAYKVTQVGIARFRDHIQQTADALFIEYVSLCFNSNGQLYANRSLRSIVENEPKLAKAWNTFQAKLETTEWGLYEVRRIFTTTEAKSAERIKAGKQPKPAVARAVKLLQTGTKYEIAMELNSLAFRADNFGLVALQGIERVYFATKQLDRALTVEGFYVGAPKTVGDKVRGPMAVFDTRFKQALLQDGASCPATRIPNPLSFIQDGEPEPATTTGSDEVDPLFGF